MDKELGPSITGVTLRWIGADERAQDWFRFMAALLSEAGGVTPEEFAQFPEEGIRRLAQHWHKYREQEIAYGDASRVAENSMRDVVWVELWLLGLWAGVRNVASGDPDVRSAGELGVLDAVRDFYRFGTAQVVHSSTAFGRNTSVCAYLLIDKALGRFIEERLRPALKRLKRCAQCDKVYAPTHPGRSKYCSDNCRKVKYRDARKT